MTPDDRTRTAPPPDDLTHSVAGTNDTVTHPPPPPCPDGGTPSGVRIIDGPDPSATVVNPDYRSAPPPLADDPPLPAFDQFQPQGEIGRGGMGVVYRALDTHFMRDVAIKVLSERLVHNRQAVRRFLEEARLTAQLTHTVIPPVHHIGTLSDGRPYLAMKLIKGRTLGERLRDRADPMADLPEYLGILEQVCLGVGYAHSRGVIHRDLKPGNIMVGAFGEVQVMDWGLAKEVNATPADDTAFAVGDEPSVSADGATKEAAPPRTLLRDVRLPDEEYTRAGTILGTPAYMSPEQASGEVARVNERSDVFSLGAMLCVLLTGQPPYTAPDTNTAVRKAIEWDTADAFRRLAQCKADPGVIDLCKRCMARDPAGRPPNAAAVAGELNDLKAAAAERLRRADLVEMAGIAKAQELKRRRAIQVGLAAAVVAILAMFGVAAWYVSDQDQKAKQAAVNEQLKDETRAADQKAKEAERAAKEAEKRATEARQAEAKRAEREAALSAAIKQAETALSECRTARGDDAWDAALERARAALGQAEFRLTEDPTCELAPRVKRLGEQVGVATKQRQLAAKLDDIATTFLEKEQISDRNPAFAERYKATFREAGYSEADPTKFARLVSEHPQPAALLEAVFDWHHHTTPDDRKVIAALLDKLAADHPFLSKWWAAQKDATPTGTVALLGLLADKAVEEQTTWVAHRLFCDLWHRGEREAAIRHMRDALVRHPSDYRLHARFALHLGVLNTPAARTEGIAHATAAIALRPKSVNAYILLGRLTAEQSGDPADALRHLDRVIGLDRASLPARIERAAVYTRLNRFKEAEDEYATINRIDPTVESRLGALRTRWANGDREAAVKELKGKLLPTVPMTGDAQLALARTCRGMYLHAEAEAAYRAAVTAAPLRLELRMELARYLDARAEQAGADRTKRLREAEEVLLKATTDFPTRFDPWWQLVWVYAQLKDGPKALAAGEKAAELGNGFSDTEYILGVAQLAAGKYPEAQATAEAFAKQYPADWRGPHLRGQIAAAQKKWREAATHAEQAAQLSPTVAELWNILGNYHGLNLDSTKAVKAYAEAVRLEPNNAVYHQNIAVQYGLLRDKRAIEHLGKAYGLDPTLKDLPPK